MKKRKDYLTKQKIIKRSSILSKEKKHKVVLYSLGSFLLFQLILKTKDISIELNPNLIFHSTLSSTEKRNFETMLRNFEVLKNGFDQNKLHNPKNSAISEYRVIITASQKAHIFTKKHKPFFRISKIGFISEQGAYFESNEHKSALIPLFTGVRAERSPKAAILKGIKIVKELQSDGVKISEVRFIELRGFAIKAKTNKNTFELLLGSNNLEKGIVKSKKLLSSLTFTNGTNYRLELDYSGKAFIKKIGQI